MKRMVLLKDLKF